MERIRRKTSVCWNYFTPIDDAFACCDLCKQNLSYKSSVTNLKKHLCAKHPHDTLYKRNQDGDCKESRCEVTNASASLVDHSNYTEAAPELLVEVGIADDTLRRKPKEQLLRKRKLVEVQEHTVPVVSDVFGRREEDEFAVFAKFIALQLRKLPLERALAAESKIQEILSDERINALRDSMSPAHMCVRCQSEESAAADSPCKGYIEVTEVRSTM